MTVLYYVNEHQSVIRAIKPGWYGMESNGKLSSGPFSDQGKCLTGITQARGNFRASPWLRRPVEANTAVHSRRMNVGGNIGFQAVSN